MKKIFEIKNDSDKKEYTEIINKIKNKDQYKVDNLFDLRSINTHIQREKNILYIILKNKYISADKKKKIFTELVEYLKEKCKLIKKFKENNKAKFNYFTGERISNSKKDINDISSEERTKGKNTKLNKADVLKILNMNKGENFSIKKKFKDFYEKERSMKKKISKSDEIEIVDVLNPFSENNIKFEWEQNKKIWYQNNQRFNPLFRDLEIKRNEERNTGNNNNHTGDLSFSHIQNINTNQQ